MQNYIKEYIEESKDTKEKILIDNNIQKTIEQIVNAIVNAYKNGKKVLTAGNGGSAGDAQHLAAELVSKFLYERKALSAISLTTNTSILTSVGNDYDHKLVFARQIQAHANEGDVFIAISTSGNSPNIVKAVEEASSRGVITVGLTGGKKSKIDEICDYLIKIPSEKTPIIQESHIMIEHIICALVEKQIFENN